MIHLTDGAIKWKGIDFICCDSRHRVKPRNDNEIIKCLLRDNYETPRLHVVTVNILHGIVVPVIRMPGCDGAVFRPNSDATQVPFIDPGAYLVSGQFLDDQLWI
jgi:hypothetical protein